MSQKYSPFILYISSDLSIFNDSYPDEDAFQEDDYDHFEDDSESDPEAEY